MGRVQALVEGAPEGLNVRIQPEYLRRAIQKAYSSQCRFKVVAIGLTKDGLAIYKTNQRRYPKKGAGLHAEERVIQQYHSLVHTIVILRIGAQGNIRPIDPCPKCRSLAEKFGIKIVSIQP